MAQRETSNLVADAGVTESFRRQGSIRKVLHSFPDNEPVFGVPARMLERTRPDSVVSHIQTFTPFFQEYSILAEYNMLREHIVKGVYVIPSDKSALLWFGVVFVRSGHYKGGVFRFNLLLPETFPCSIHPRVIFEKNIFHPTVNEDTGELSLRNGFPEWRKDVHYIWQAVEYIGSIFYNEDAYLPINQEAYHLYKNNEEEFAMKASECAKKSVQCLFDTPEFFDLHYLKFEQYDESIHGETKQFLLKSKDKSSEIPKGNGLTWVRHGTLDPFSKLVS